jgi:hypothetical protein
MGVWNDATSVAVLRGKLRGEAARYARDTPSVRALGTVDLMELDLRGRFVPVIPVAIKMGTLMDMAQKENESVRSYATRVERVGREINVVGTAQDSLILGQFMKSVLPHIRRNLLSKRPPTFALAIENAVIEEEALLLMNSGTRTRLPVKAVQLEDTEQGEASAPLIAEASLPSPSPAPKMGRDRPDFQKQILERLDKLSPGDSAEPSDALGRSGLMDKITRKLDELEQRWEARFLSQPRDRLRDHRPMYPPGREVSTEDQSRLARPAGNCFFCHQPGHYAVQCPQRPSFQGNRQPPDNRRVYSQAYNGGSGEGPSGRGSDSAQWRQPTSQLWRNPQQRPGQNPAQVRAEYDFCPYSSDPMEEDLNENGNL